MRHYLYKTTNVENNKIYIGIHSDEEDFGVDNYMGSGVALQSAFKKYGRENFRCELLVEESSREKILELEELVVDEEFVNRRDTYNLKTGGSCGIHSQIVRDKISKAKTGVPVHSEEFKHSQRQKMKGEHNINYQGKSWTTESREKRKAYSGENSPIYGRNHSEESKKIMCEKAKGPKKMVTCPHCGETGGEGNMKRYHFDNCPTIKEVELVKCPHCDVTGRPGYNMNRYHFDSCINLEPKDKIKCPHCDYESHKKKYMEERHFDNCRKVKEKETVTCPHCNTTGGKANMKRWHFDNCPSIKPKENLICPHCSKEGRGGNMTRYHFDNCKYKN